MHKVGYIMKSIFPTANVKGTYDFLKDIVYNILVSLHQRLSVEKVV